MSVKNTKPADTARTMVLGPRGLEYLLAGFVVMVSGIVLMIGGGSDDPQVFNWAMFDFQRLVAAPLVILAGVAIQVIAIMRVPNSGSGKKEDRV